MRAVLCHAICHLFKKLNFFRINWIPNLMVQFHYLRLFLGIQWNHCLWSVATDSNDGHGLNLEKAGLRFSSFNAMPTKITKKWNEYGQCYLMIFVLSSLPLSLWKRANISPVHMSGDKEQVTNYRSISLLSIPAKCLERIAHSPSYDHVAPSLSD